MYFCVITFVQFIYTAIKVISTFSHELVIFNNKRFNTYEYSSLHSLGLMNLHMKSAKHVKMNITSFVSQHFFKGLQQIGETEMLSRVNFGRKMYLIPCEVVYCHIFF